MVGTEDVLSALAASLLFASTFVTLLAFLRTYLPAGMAVVAVPLIAVSVWAAAIELLSAVAVISRASLTATAAALAVVTLTASIVQRSGWGLFRGDLASVGRFVGSLAHERGWWRWPVLLSMGAAAATIAVSFVVAALGAPNNADSLGYHLPRVMWWLQEGQVGPYVSPNSSQATFPPLHEYLLLLVHGVSGSDVALNLVQWTAGLFAVAAIVSCAWEIFTSATAVALSFVFAATIPTGIVESTTTQSDWVAALWPILALTLVVGRARGRITVVPYALLLACAGALTMATKPTGALATGLVVLIAAWWEFMPPVDSTHRPARERLGSAGLIVLTVGAGSLLGGIPQILRNISFTGSATGVKTDIFVNDWTPAIMWANTVRTLVNNIGIPPPFSNAINDHLPAALAALGVPWSDPDAIHLNNVVHVGLGRNEDLTTNPVHIVLGLAVAVVVALWPAAPRMLRYVAATSAILFTVTAGIFQWQEWSTRFFLAGTVLSCLPLAWLAARWLESSPSRVNARGAASAVLVMATASYGLAVAVAQEYRPLLGPGSILTTPRIDQYFRVVGQPGSPDLTQADLLARLAPLAQLPPGSTIGLRNLYNEEYLVWRILNADGQYTLVNLDGLDGRQVVDPETVDGVICQRGCPWQG